jgi:hypothetical protein
VFLLPQYLLFSIAKLIANYYRLETTNVSISEAYTKVNNFDSFPNVFLNAPHAKSVGIACPPAVPKENISVRLLINRNCTIVDHE